MRETWRWFGEFDPIALKEISQTGAKGIVSALHAIPYGEIWLKEDVVKRHDEIKATGFTWDVVESLPIHEDIKRGTGDLPLLFANYRQSLANLAADGIKTVCYNFMPILDWTRTDLAAPVANRGTCLRFSAAKMAAFEIHMLGRDKAREDYHPNAILDGDKWFEESSETSRAKLLHAVMSGLPGAVDSYDLDELQAVLQTYTNLSHSDLRGNLSRFLQEVIPTAAELGINMCIHPDDPPCDILGLPRIVSTDQDIHWILQAVDESANGLTLCTGSLGAIVGNDVLAITQSFASRIHFAHLRNVSKDIDGSFEESAHLEGDVDLVPVINEIIKTETKRGVDIPFRADHGHVLLSDVERDFQPGYTLIGRMRSLAELRGVVAALV